VVVDNKNKKDWRETIMGEEENDKDAMAFQ
jgi:hypothetical protein